MNGCARMWWNCVIYQFRIRDGTLGMGALAQTWVYSGDLISLIILE